MSISRPFYASIKGLKPPLEAIIILRAEFLSRFHINIKIDFLCLLLAHHLIFKLENKWISWWWCRNVTQLYLHVLSDYNMKTKAPALWACFIPVANSIRHILILIYTITIPFVLQAQKPSGKCMQVDSNLINYWQPANNFLHSQLWKWLTV